MTMGIIHLFEVIDIQQHQGNWVSLSDCATPFLLKSGIEIGAIFNAGHDIDGVEFFQSFMRRG